MVQGHQGILKHIRNATSLDSSILLRKKNLTLLFMVEIILRDNGHQDSLKFI